MNSVDRAYETQLNNIQKKTGKSMDELTGIIQHSGLTKYSEIRDMLKRELKLGHGDATQLVKAVLEMQAAQALETPKGDVLDDIYTGAKAGLRPIHDRLMETIDTFGEFEVSPKKGYISLRRKRQFAMIGPATNTRVEVGINHKTLGAHPRLIQQPAGSMCNFIVKISRPEEVDAELFDWLKQAFDSAG